jgi:hypothetical protein
VERPSDPYEDVTQLRFAFGHLSSDMREVKHDIRRLDDRIFQVLLIQLVTLATALGSLVAALVTATR